MLVNSKKNFGNFIKNITGKKIYTRQEMQTVASAAALAKMVKTIIDTNILDNNGHVTDESEQVILQIQDKMNSGEPLVKRSEPERQQQQPQYQQQTPINMNKSNTENVVNSVKTIYNPNGFIKFIMWAHTIFYAFCGVCLVFAGTFIAGAIWFAAGLMMCPKINKTMKFWPRFGLMILLIIIGAFSSMLSFS
jgi:hypothetical protein